MTDEFNNDSLLELYLYESSSLLDSLDNVLLNAESNGSLTGENLNEIFRIMHTVKGSSTMMSYNGISEVAHKTEDLFALLRKHGLDMRYSGELFDLVLTVSDFLKAEVGKLQEKQPLEADVSALCSNVLSLTEKMRAHMPKEPMPDFGRILGAPIESFSAPGKQPEPENRNDDTFTLEFPLEETFGAGPPKEGLRGLKLPKEDDFTLEFPLEDAFGTAPPKEDKHSIGLPKEDSLTTDIPIEDAFGAAPPKEDKHSIGLPKEDALTTDIPIEDAFGAAPPKEGKRGIEPPKEDAFGIEPPIEDGRSFLLHIRFNEGAKLENVRAAMLINKLSEKGTVKLSIPAGPDKNPDAADYILEHGFYVSYTSSLTREQIETLVKGTLSVKTIDFVSKLPSDAGRSKSINEYPGPQSRLYPAPETRPRAQTPPAPQSLPAFPGARQTPRPQTSPEPQTTGRFHTDSQTHHNYVSVEIKKLDSLLDLVGEISLSESIVTKTPDLEGFGLKDFRQASRRLDKLTGELQDTVISIRMLPVSMVFQRMRRVVRDMGKSLGKDVNLLLAGETTELDKTVLDALSDPILHLVRNAMDHAIEKPAERIKAGKSASGHIVLSAQSDGGDVIISVSDDGRGLDKNAVLSQARANGLLSKPEREYTEKEVFNNLLLSPGLSTTEHVSEYSGRGVGLDVVKNNIEKIGGSVIVESKKGSGTSIILKIPLTLAIISCIQVALGEGIYSIPINNVREALTSRAGRLITDPSGAEMILLRGKSYPIMRLYKQFGVLNAVTNISEGILLRVEADGQCACLLADNLVGRLQVVAKPLPAYLNRFKVKRAGVSGCTIMNDGAISLIVNVHEMAKAGPAPEPPRFMSAANYSL